MRKRVVPVVASLVVILPVLPWSPAVAHLQELEDLGPRCTSHLLALNGFAGQMATWLLRNPARPRVGSGSALLGVALIGALANPIIRCREGCIWPPDTETLVEVSDSLAHTKLTQLYTQILDPVVHAHTQNSLTCTHNLGWGWG